MDTDSKFVGSIPDVYDEYLVPLIFEGYADDLADRTAALRPDRVLETAAGSGVVARALRPRLGAQSRYVATDLNQPMLDRASSRQEDANGLTWELADAMSLPYEGGSFDAVICQFGLMFFPDRVAGLAEAKRVLSDEGACIVSVWDAIEANEFAQTVTDAAATIFPAEPPNFLARVAHGYHDTVEIEREFSEAGFDSVEIETISRKSVAPSPRHPAIAYCQGTPLRNEIEARDPEQLNAVTDAAEQALRERFGTSSIVGGIRAHVVTAR